MSRLLTQTADDEPARLAFARLAAGQHPDSPAAQFDHAVVALLTGHDDEAEHAIRRFADTAPTWDRRARAQALTTLTTTHRHLGDRIHALRQALANADPNSR